MKRTLLLAGWMALGTLLGGCAANGAVIVRYGPPPPRYGVIGVAPGAGYVWTEGYYNWSGGAYVWTPGRWMRPPHPRAVWVPGAWVGARHGYAFRRGHWR
jgi:hypothetical protein